MGSSPSAFPLGFWGQQGSLGNQRCPGAVPGSVGCGAELREAGTPASRPAPPSGSSRPRSPRPRRRSSLAVPGSAPAPSSPLAQPGAAPSAAAAAAAAARTRRSSAPTMRAQLWLLQLLLLRGAARALSPATAAGRTRGQGRCRHASGTRVLSQDAGERGQGPCFPCVRTEGAHLLLLSEGRGGTQPGVPRIVAGTRVHSREAFAFSFPCSSLLPPSAALGGVPVGLVTAWESPEDGRHPGPSVAV